MRVAVKINFTNTTYTELTSPESEGGQINVSNLDSIINETSFGFKGFQLSGISKLDGSTKFFPSTGYPGYISANKSDSEGNISDVIRVTFSGEFPAYIYITFDQNAKERATNFTVSNDQNDTVATIQNNSNTSVAIASELLGLSGYTGTVTLSFIFTKWSKSNSCIHITSISTDQQPVFTGADLISINCSENLFDAQMQITPGICEQYANITVYDRGKLLHERAKSGLLTADYTLEISAIDDTTSEQKELGTYIISEWGIYSNKSEVNITCRDKTYLFEKINIARSGIKDRTLHDLLDILFSQAPGMPWMYDDNTTMQRCKNIVLPNNWYVASDLYTMLNKVCALGMLRIYWYIDTFIVGRCF